MQSKPVVTCDQPTLKLQKLQFVNNSTKLFKPLSVALPVPVSLSRSGTMAPCGFPVLKGRELLFTAGQDTQLSGRWAPFLSLSLPAAPPPPLPHLFLDHTFTLQPPTHPPPLCLDHPDNCLIPVFSPALHCLSEGEHLLNSSCSARFHVFLFRLNIKSSLLPKSHAHTYSLVLFLCPFAPRTIITFLEWHFSRFSSFNLFITQISSLPIPASVPSSPLSYAPYPSSFHPLIPSLNSLFSSLCLRGLVPSSFPPPLLPAISCPNIPHISVLCPLFSVSTELHATQDGCFLFVCFFCQFAKNKGSNRYM